MSQQELEQLMEQTLPVASRMLQEDGLLIPYGAVMQLDGTVLPVGVEITRSDMRARDVIEILRDNMVDFAHGGNCKATAVFYAVKVSLPDTGEHADAVAVALSHSAGDALMVFHPFDQTTGTIRHGSSFAVEDRNTVFRPLH